MTSERQVSRRGGRNPKGIDVHTSYYRMWIGTNQFTGGYERRSVETACLCFINLSGR